MAGRASCSEVCATRLLRRGFPGAVVFGGGALMPEGHTLHRAARDQRPLLVGHEVAVSSPQGRFEAGAKVLTGRQCLAVEAWGKHLLYKFEGELTLHIHLGLFGRFRRQRQPAAEPRGAVRVRLEGPTHAIDVNGPTACEVLAPQEVDALCARLGADPLRADADSMRAYARISRSRSALGLLLMDQSVIAGIGNIYRTEILWRQRLHPLQPGNSLSVEAFRILWADACALLALGVERNAIVTVPHALPARSRYRERVNIFGKEHCPTCAGPIQRFLLATRKVYACEQCQPPPIAA